MVIGNRECQVNRVLWGFFVLSVAVLEGKEAKLYLQLGHSDWISSVAFSSVQPAGRTPAWSWPRSRRSGCLPAEPYPPLRPLVVYP